MIELVLAIDVPKEIKHTALLGRRPYLTDIVGKLAFEITALHGHTPKTRNGVDLPRDHAAVLESRRHTDGNFLRHHRRQYRIGVGCHFCDQGQSFWVVDSIVGEAVECDLAVQHGSRDHLRETMIGRLSRLGRPLFLVSCGTSVCEIGRVERDGRDLPKIANLFGYLCRGQDGRLYCALRRVRLHATCVDAELTFPAAELVDVNFKRTRYHLEEPGVAFVDW